MKRIKHRSAENTEFGMEFGDINADKFFELPFNRDKEKEDKKSKKPKKK
ncbi:hypothetical protein [Heyndrickxia acidicola]|jgi:hypothetical protein|uniref:Uncharacterized protein n=1 Tax=Heyndrickxia acidicola TaxID=209389 RepID=A0ABU6MHY9_9BACI|nr:hypothetical protein [Heyndrickxia acidicola]MED1204295.1 hypothetical protein [Heyndrickxia acidicola]